MSSKSLRKGVRRNPTERVSKNLHFIKGEHNVNHSHSPISADEIERLVAIDANYADRLFTIMEKSVELEGKEVELYFNAVKKEQENDELSILEQSKIGTKSLYLSVIVLTFLIFSAAGFAYMGKDLIAAGIVTAVIGVVIKAIMGKSDKS